MKRIILALSFCLPIAIAIPVLANFGNTAEEWMANKEAACVPNGHFLSTFNCTAAVFMNELHARIGALENSAGPFGAVVVDANGTVIGPAIPTSNRLYVYIESIGKYAGVHSLNDPFGWQSVPYSHVTNWISEGWGVDDCANPSYAGVRNWDVWWQNGTLTQAKLDAFVTQGVLQINGKLYSLAELAAPIGPADDYEKLNSGGTCSGPLYPINTELHVALTLEMDLATSHPQPWSVQKSQ